MRRRLERGSNLSCSCCFTFVGLDQLKDFSGTVMLDGQSQAGCWQTRSLVNVAAGFTEYRRSDEMNGIVP